MLEVKIDPSIPPRGVVPNPEETPDTVTRRKRRARLNFQDGTTTQLLYDEGELWPALKTFLDIEDDYLPVTDSDGGMRITRKGVGEAAGEDYDKSAFSSFEAPTVRRSQLPEEDQHAPLLGLIRQPGKPLNDTQRRQIMHLLDLKDNAKASDPNRKLTNRRIAELTNTHEKTIGRLRRERRIQGCVQTQDDGQRVTTDPPVPGRQGGYRWCRMNADQMTYCSRIAVENPQLTLTEVRDRVLEAYPGLVLSRTTVGRVLNGANLQMLRAKMRDPRAEGTHAHKAEKEAFLAEQQKGEEGVLGAHNLFFMDETVVPLNLTSKRAWGTRRRPAEVLHAKGKTMTIGVYAGLGLVSDSWSEWPSAPSSVKTLDHTTPRGNHLQKREDGTWVRATSPPRFMLYWWIRPPRRENTVLSRFLDGTDVMDPNMTWYDGATRHFFKQDEAGGVDDAAIRSFVDSRWDELSLEELTEALWKNNIEFRQTDDDGNLVQIVTKNKAPSHIYASEEQMRGHLRGLQELVKKSFMLTDSPTTTHDYTRIPRYYFTNRGREQKGGTLDSERGDRSLFLRYLKLHRDYVEENFPTNIRENLVHAWDSAPQHGKTDVTKNTKSFVHDWVREHLKVRGAVFLPVREPDFNPVELLFAFVKGVIRRRFPRDTGDVSVDDMVSLIDAAFGEVTEEMVQGWLRYGCYRIPGDPHADKVCKNLRCGYVTQASSVDAMWNGIIEQWEGRHVTLPSAVRRDLLTLDKQDAPSKLRTRNAAVGRFQTIHDVFTKSPKIVQQILWKRHTGTNVTIVHGGSDKLWERTDPRDSFTITYADGMTADVDNYASEQHRQLDAYIAKLLEDSSGFALLAMTCKEDASASHDLVAAITTFEEERSGRSGLLSILRICKDAADDIATTVRGSEALKAPAPAENVGLLLDIQERVFHPKLDMGLKIDSTGAATTRLPSNVRTQLHSYIKYYDNKAPGQRITAVNGNRVVFGSREFENDRLYKAALKKTQDEIVRRRGGEIEAWLRETAYHPCIPDGDAPGRAYGLAVVALKAYTHETQRVHDILISSLNRYWAAESDRERTTAFENGLSKWRRLCNAGSGCTSRLGERTRSPSSLSVRAEDQPPLFLIPSLRTERIASLQLLALGRGEQGERRWPGYPLREEGGRDGQAPFRTVGSGGVQTVRPVKRIRIKERVSQDKSVFYDALVTFEDGESVHLFKPVQPGAKKAVITTSAGKTYDREYYQTTFNNIFGPGCELNANILALATQRFDNQDAKPKGGKDTGEGPKKPAIVGVLQNTPVVLADAPIRNSGSTRLVYNPDLSKLHPPRDWSMKDTIEVLRDPNQTVLDRKHFWLPGQTTLVKLSSGSLTGEYMKSVLRRYSLKEYLPGATIHDISPEKNKRIFRIVQGGQRYNFSRENSTRLFLGETELDHNVNVRDQKLLSEQGGHIVTRGKLCRFLDDHAVDARSKDMNSLYTYNNLDYHAASKRVRLTESEANCSL